MAEKVGLSAGTVLRIWRKHALQPYRVDTFKFSTDPDLTTKLADVIGLERAITAYMEPWNDSPKPFTWTKTPVQVLWRIRRKNRDATRDT